MKSVSSCVAFLSLIACGLSIPQADSQTKLSNTWSSAGQLTQARSGAASVQMTDGRILITGGTDGNGVPQATAEAYDPGTGVFSALPAMNVPRANHAATILLTGDVLVTGGLTSGGGYSDSAEIYGFKTHTWTLLPSLMDTGLAGHAMVLLSDGNVLIAGGVSTAKVVSSIVLFNAASQTFTQISTLLTSRTNAVAAGTPDGRVLIAGGADINGVALASTEIFTYSKSTMTGTIAAGPTMSSARVYASATTSYDGVAVIGGNNGQNDLGTAEIFSQWTNKFRVVTGGTPRSHHFAVLLPKNGSILAMGGTGGVKVDLLQPWMNSTAGAFLAAPDSLNNQDGGFGAPAGLGSLLAAGGTGKNATSAELYSFPTVSTQNPEYAPGTKVEISGTGFKPNETIDLHIHEWVNQSTEDVPDATVTADALGNFSYDGYSPDQGDIGARYHLTAVGESSGDQAQTIFGDSISSIDFSNPPLNLATGACGKLTLTVGGSGSYGTIYLYDSTTTGTFYSNAACTTAITQIAGAATVTLYYANTTAGTPDLLACDSANENTCITLFGFPLADYGNQTETIYGPKLAWTVLPSGGAPGAVFAVQPTVEVLSSSGTVVTTSTALITLTLTCNGGFGTCTGSLTCTSNPLNATAGVAAFSGCSATPATANQYCLVASSPGIAPTGATDACFNVTAVSTGNSSVVASPTTVPADGTSTSTITVTLNDTLNDPVVGKTITLTPGSGASVISAGSNGGVTDENGVVTFTVTDATVQNVTYTAKDSTDSITIGTVQVGFTSTGTTLLLAAPSAPVIPLSTATPETLTATLTDTATGAPLNGATVTFTILPGGTGCTATTSTNGVYSCGGTAPASATAGTTYTVGATSAAVTISGVTYALATGMPTQIITVSTTPLPVLAWTTPPPSTKPYAGTFNIAGHTTTAGDTGAISYSVTGACTIGTVNGVPNTVTMTSGTGPCYVTLSIGEKSVRVGAVTTYYPANTLTSTVTATKATQTPALTVTCAPSGTCPGSAPDQSMFTIGYSGGAGTGAVTFAVIGSCTISGTQVTMNASTGTCSITVTKAGDLNYASATSTPPTVISAISGSGAVVVSCTQVTYNGSPQTTACSATSTPSGLEVDLTYSPTPPTNAGTYTVTGTINDPNYTGTGTGTLTISPEPVTATAVSVNSVYTGVAIPTPACLLSGAFTSNLTCADSPATVGPNVGSGTLTPVVTYGTDVSGNYIITPVNSTWTITRASSSVTLSCAPGTFPYTGAAITPCVATVTSPDSTQVATIQYANNINAGTASAVASVAGTTNAASSNSALTTFTITQQTALITLTNNSPYAYTGSQVPLTATTTPTGLANTITYAGINPTVYPQTTVPPILPGSYTVVATITDPNYSGMAPATEVISPIAAPMTLTLDQSSSNPSVYGTPVAFDLNVNNGAATCPTGTVQLWVNGSKSGAAIALPVDCGSSVFFQVADLPVGQNSIYATYSGDKNYPSAQSGTLTQTVNADGTSMTLTTTGTTVNVGQSVTFTATITLAASINGTATVPDGTVSFYQCTSPATTCDGSNGTELGTPQAISGITSNTASSALTTSLTAQGSYIIGAVYTPTVSDLDYTGSSAILAETVTVNPDAPIIAWPYPTAIVYGTQLSATQLDATAGYPTAIDTIPGTFAYTPDTGVVLDAGNQVLNVTFTPSDLTTYSVQKSQQNLTVLPATLTVTPDPQTMVFGTAIPTFTYQIAGCVNGDSCDATSNPVWTGTADCTTGATSTSPAGNYPITCSVGTLTAANYTFTFVAGQLTITAGTSLTITTLPKASNITYTQTLASSVLTGGVAKYNGATVAGTFAWTTPGTVPVAGTAPYSVTFTATDVSDYNTATGNVSVTVLLATPAVTAWPTAAPISLGQPLSASALSGGVATYNGTAVAGTFAWTTPTNVPSAAGTTAYSVTFTPTDTADYNTVAGTVNITVNNLGTPTITTLPTATGLTYGQPLSASTLSNGVASVPGKFAWTNPATVPGAGPQPESITFTPTDTVNYNTATGTVTVTVAKATPTIGTPPAATAISVGQTLAASTLSGGAATNPNGGAAVPGIFAWTTPTTAPAAGTPSESVTFTPTDTIDYNTATVSITVTVNNKTATTITVLPTASAIIYGQTLASSTLTGGTGSVSGTFAWTTPTTVPTAGADPEGVTFTPTDTTDYNTASGTITVTVSKATPTVSVWPTAAAISVGQALSSSTLTPVTAAVPGNASVAGTFAWTTPATVPALGADLESVTFTPTDTTDYNTVTSTILITVNNKTTPTITTLPTASAITYGQTLASSTLTGGTGSVPGTFAWTTPATAPGAGTPPESITFTPTNTTLYNTATGTVTVTVNKATPTVTTLPTASALSVGQALSASTLTGGLASTPGTFAWTTPGTIPVAGADPESVTFTPYDSTDYTTATATVTVTVGNLITPTVTAWPKAASIFYGQVLGSSVLTGGTASVPGTFGWTTPTTVPTAGADPEGVTFTPTDTTKYTTVAGTVTVNVSKVTPTVTAWPTPSAIAPGKTLASSTLAGGTASYNGTTVPGTFAWTAPATIPAAGTDVESVTFTPTDATDYNTVVGTVTITVNNKTTPTVTALPTASAITFGQTLAASTLSGGTASVAGTFAWTTPTTAPAVGAAAESVTFTPTDTADYNTATGTVMVTVNKATPTVTVWPTASALAVGQALSASVLTGGTASVAGTFAWTAPATIPVAGADAENVTFTPTDTTDYNTVTGTVTVRVGNKTTPTVTAWPTAGVIYIGQTLASSVLTGGTASVTGTFAWTTPTTVPPVGATAEGLTFTPTDTTSYNTVAGSVKVTVSSATGRVLTVAANSQSRTYGAANPALTYAVTGFVNGDTIAIVKGAAACTTTAAPASAVGKYPITCTEGTLSATNYTFQFIKGTLTISQADTTTSVKPSSSSVNPGQSVTLTAKVVSATTGTPTGSVAFYEGTTLLGTGTLASGTAEISTSSLTAGTADTIEAVYSGDDNFITSFGSTAVSEASLDFTLAISGAASANVNQGSAATFQIAVKPLYGTYPGPVTFTSVGAPSTAAVTFSPSTIEANGGSTTVTLTIKTSGSANLAPADTGSKRSPLAWALVLIPLLGLSRLRRQGRRLSRLATLLLLLGCTLAGAMVTGCGGSVNLIEHDYSVVVTATSGNVIHNIPVTLDVK